MPDAGYPSTTSNRRLLDCVREACEQTEPGHWRRDDKWFCLCCQKWERFHSTRGHQHESGDPSSRESWFHEQRPISELSLCSFRPRGGSPFASSLLTSRYLGRECRITLWLDWRKHSIDKRCCLSRPRGCCVKTSRQDWGKNRPIWEKNNNY